MSEIDVAGALDALEARGGMPDVVPSTGQDPFNRNAMGQFASPAAPTPAAPVEGAGNVAAPAAPEAPAATPETGTATEGEPAFTHIDPSTLPPDLQTLYRGMQADYTRKTQEVASWRKLADETGVSDPSQVREYIQVAQRLSDPQNWGQIHQELGQYMQQLGMSPQAASAAATEAIAEFAPADQAPDFSEYGEDLAPLMQAFQAQQKQIQELTQSIQQDRQQQQQQSQFAQVASHLEQQESALRTARPDLTEGDYEVIYSLMGEDANMASAVAKYDSVIAQRLQATFNAKVAQGGSIPTPLAGGGVVTSATPEGRPEGMDPVDWGHQQAMRALSAMESAG